MLKASRKATDDFERNIFSMPRFQEDLLDFGAMSTEAGARGEFSWSNIMREGRWRGESKDPVDIAGEDAVMKEAGVGGRGGGASNCVLVSEVTGRSAHRFIGISDCNAELSLSSFAPQPTPTSLLP